MSIYIGNLSYEVSENDLRQVFEDYGKVVRVSLPIDRETDRSRGFAFIEMSSQKEEASAINALNEAEWLGRTLRVNEAKPRQPRSGNGARDTSSRESASWSNPRSYSMNH